MIFVFGSNAAGRHGRGAAEHARRHHGARYGVGFGRQGESYAIATKGLQLEQLPLAEIKPQVQHFLEVAVADAREIYFVTRIGCGLAQHRDADIAPWFRNAPFNCVLPPEWIQYTRPNVFEIPRCCDHSPIALTPPEARCVP